MHASDPRSDPVVVDLIELAGIWVAADDRPALRRTLARLDQELSRRFPADEAFSERFRALLRLSDTSHADAEQLRRTYRRASVG